MVDSRQQRRILIVDDEDSIRYTFAVFLQREGYGNITTAATLDEAFAAIRAEEFDLIISDIVLEDTSGTELLKHLHEAGSNCPVVMITGFPHLDTAAESLRYGAFDYISKPVNKETLLRFVSQALKHRDLEREKQELQQENEKYRRYLETVFSSVSDAILTVDDSMNIIQLNEVARNWLCDGCAAEGRNLATIENELSAACLIDAKAVIEGGQTVREHQLECSNIKGEKRMFSLNGAPLVDRANEFTGVVIVARDMSLAGLPVVKQGRNRFHGFVGISPAMQGIYRLIENVGKVDAAVLVTGESGTGKEIAAEALHAESLRRNMPLVKVDCASVSEDLLESELFGHKKGAFTGADRDRPGRLLQADGGTLFLDEIGDISQRMQLRLLRFLQEKTFTPVGQDTPVQVDVRVIAATNVELQKKVRAGIFREDLYYRLKVVEIFLPPLRERSSCIPLLVHHFLVYFAEKHGQQVTAVSDQVMQLLQTYSWPGNVRELRHVIERGCVICDGPTIFLEHLPAELRDTKSTGSAEMATYSHDALPPDITVEPKSEQEILLEMLARVGGNKAKAARMLGIDRSTLYRKLKRYQSATE